MLIEWRRTLRVFVAALTLCGIAVLAVPAHAQQIVETSTGKHIADGNCAVSEAMLTAIQGGEVAHKAETRTRLNALLDAALASPKNRQTAQSPVVFPPRPGS
jgi:hypothetical protein